MINKDITNATTEVFMDQVKSIMRSKGYKLRTSKHSAEVEYAFEKEKSRVSICGWHGDGRYGKLKLMMSMYAGPDFVQTELVPIFTMPGNDPTSYGAGLPRDAKNDQIDEDEFEAYKANIIKAKEWITENA
jgi:hypothetical protein